MNQINSKKALAMILSRVKPFDKPNFLLEQYPTDSETAAEIVWTAYLQGDIEGKTVADLGSGPGILGIGAILLGSKKVIFAEKDPKAIKVLEENLKMVENEAEKDIALGEIESLEAKVDTVLMNPPFGTKQKHADKAFLEKAMEIAKKIYSIHKSTSASFIEKLSSEKGFKIIGIIKIKLPIKQTMSFHTKKIERVDTSLWVLERI